VAYLYHLQTDRRQTALIFDFGGGTLDLTVARVGGSEPPEILATAGVPVGGDDLDRRIMESLLPYFGGGPDGRLPPSMVAKLLDWQTIPELSQPYNIAQIRQIIRDVADPRPYEALETLVTNNVGYSLFKAIEGAKQQLSTQNSARIDFDYEAIHIHETLTRRRFERLIAPEVEQVRAGIDAVLAGADGVSIDVVLRTGGSSLVPAFYNLLQTMFGADRVEAVHPLVSVTGGFAIRAFNTAPRAVLAPEQVITAAQVETGRSVALTALRLDERPFTDRDFTISRVAARLDGLPAVRLPNLDHEVDDADYLRLTLAQPARVMVAYEVGATQLPDWMADFSMLPLWLEIEDSFARISRRMQVYCHEYPAGEVVLGGCRAAGYEGEGIVNYFVIVEPLD
jgi:hypothetical protein